MPKRDSPIAFRPDEQIRKLLQGYREKYPAINSDSKAVLAILKDKSLEPVAKVEPTKTAKTISPTFARTTLTTDSEMIDGEVAKLFRGQPSPYIEALLHMTEASVDRSMCIATPTGLVYFIPSATHDHIKKGG